MRTSQNKLLYLVNCDEVKCSTYNETHIDNIV